MIFKKNIYCLFILMSIFSYSQEIKFQLFVKDNCKGVVEKLDYYNLRKDDIDFYPSDNSGIVILKDKGIYQLSTMYSEDIVTYEIKEYGIINDTISLPIIKLCMEATSHPNFIGYCCCGIECDGNKIDYYSNGNKLTEGYFKNGRPIGKLKRYYPDGSIKEIEKYSKKGKLLKTRKYKLKRIIQRSGNVPG